MNLCTFNVGSTRGWAKRSWSRLTGGRVRGLVFKALGSQ